MRPTTKSPSVGAARVTRPWPTAGPEPSRAVTGARGRGHVRILIRAGVGA